MNPDITVTRDPQFGTGGKLLLHSELTVDVTPIARVCLGTRMWLETAAVGGDPIAAAEAAASKLDGCVIDVDGVRFVIRVGTQRVTRNTARSAGLRRA